MIRLKKKLLIYELDCFYSIFSTDYGIISKIFSNIIIPKIVYDDFKNKINEDMQENIDELLDSKFVVLEDFEVQSKEYTMYKRLIKGIDCKSMGKLESAAITLAKSQDLTILSNSTNDNFNELDIESVLLSDLIFSLYAENVISLDEAEVLWNNLSTSSSKLLSLSFNQYVILKET